MPIRFLINDIGFLNYKDPQYVDSIALGHNLTLISYDEPPVKYGEVTIVDDGDVIFRGIVQPGGFSQEFVDGRIINTFLVTDFSPRLSYQRFSGRFQGNLLAMISLMITRAGQPFDSVLLNISDEAMNADVNVSITRMFLLDALPLLLENSGFNMQFTVRPTGELEIYEYGYGELAPFNSIVELDNSFFVTGDNRQCYGNIKITDSPARYSVVEVVGKNPDKTIVDHTNTNLAEGDFPVSFEATPNTNIYSNLPANADLISAMLTTWLVSDGNPSDFSLWAIPGEMTILQDQPAIYAFAATSGDPNFNLAEPTLTLNTVAFPMVGASGILASPTNAIFSIDKTIKINDNGYAQLTIQSASSSLLIPVGDYTLLAEGTVTVGMVTVTASVSFILHVLPIGGSPEDPCPPGFYQQLDPPNACVCVTNLNCFLQYSPNCCAF